MVLVIYSSMHTVLSQNATRKKVCHVMPSEDLVDVQSGRKAALKPGDIDHLPTEQPGKHLRRIHILMMN